MDYINQYGRRMVCPIWGGPKDFDFTCMGHIEFAEAMGFKTYQATPVLRLVQENQIPDSNKLDAFFRTKGDMQHIFEAEVNQFTEMKQQNNHLHGGGCFGPLTVVSDVLGIERLLRLIVKDPAFVLRFLDDTAFFMMQLAAQETAAGDDFFWIAEPVASLLSTTNFWTFSGQFLHRIFESSNVPGFLHICGKTLRLTESMVLTGAQVLSIDQQTDLKKSMETVPEDIVIMGNVDPSLLHFGTKEEIREEIRKMNRITRSHRNYIMSTGCSVHEGTPEENVMLLYEEAEDASV